MPFYLSSRCRLIAVHMYAVPFGRILFSPHTPLFRAHVADCAHTEVSGILHTPSHRFTQRPRLHHATQTWIALCAPLVCLIPGASRWGSAVAAMQTHPAPSFLRLSVVNTMRAGTSSARRGGGHSRLRPWSYEPTPIAISHLSVAVFVCW